MSVRWWCRPILAGYGRPVIAVACLYEVTALFSDLPTISQMVRRHPPIGVGLLALLAHHFYLEAE